jgi:uncharacterized membrane protein
MMQEVAIQRKAPNRYMPVIAVMVGVVLIAINQRSATISGQMTRDRVFQMCLAMLVPCLVSTPLHVATRSERVDRHRSFSPDKCVCGFASLE